MGGAVAIGGRDDVLHGRRDLAEVGATEHESGVVGEPTTGTVIGCDGEPGQGEAQIDQDDPAGADLGQPCFGNTRQAAGGDDPVVVGRRGATERTVTRANPLSVLAVIEPDRPDVRS